MDLAHGVNHLIEYLDLLAGFFSPLFRGQYRIEARIYHGHHLTAETMKGWDLDGIEHSSLVQALSHGVEGRVLDTERSSDLLVGFPGKAHEPVENLLLVNG